MDSPGPLAWLTQRNFHQEMSYTFPLKNNISNKTPLKKSILHPKKTFLILIPKKP